MDIPDEAKRLYIEEGITELFPPQEDAIKSGLFDGKNIVLAVPTASGKTLVAEIASIKHVKEKRGKVLYLVPLKALATEKYEDFKKLSRIGMKVILSTGDFDSLDPTLGKYDIIIATNEKADSLFRHKPSWLASLSLLVVDEIHLLGDGSRGPTLEAMITRFRMLNANAQILGLSATISNSDEIAGWLEARLVASNWRPVPLLEGVYCGETVMFKDGKHKKIEGNDQDPVARLATDTIRCGGQILIFTGSRLSATSLAKRLEPSVGKMLKPVDLRRLSELSSKIQKTGEKTRISDKLAKTVACGVAFHHAGLTYAQRRIVEDGFRSFSIKCICATPTLAAGVNTPARRVLIYDYRRYEAGIGQTNIPVLEEKQMAGRAGRPKYDREGEAILLAKNEEERDFLFEQYVLAKSEKVWSKLGVASSLRSHILAAITMGLAYSQEGVFDFLERTFCAYQYGINSFRSAILESIEMLTSSKMVVASGKKLLATPLGRRVSELYIDPKSAVVLIDGLSRRISGLPPTSYLTLISHTPDMPKIYMRRKDAELLRAFLDSNSDLFLYDLPNIEEGGFEYEVLLSEIKTSLLLKDWITEVPEDNIVETYDVGSGDIYAYVESAKWLVHSAHELAKLMKYEESLRPLLDLMIRVENGVKEELLPLIAVHGVGRVRARALFSSGFKNIDDLKAASPLELGRVPAIGPETIRLIKEQVGGKISQEEWSKVRSNKGTSQSSIEDYR